MIKNAGLGVAMNNGAPSAKEVARVVAPSNDQDGVAVVLEQYILNKNLYGIL
ncbi:MAG: HAD hydrolase family protein [Clostridia bacterium]|nr:HAD hydrolase family protein [Clostridia bacterium]